MSGWSEWSEVERPDAANMCPLRLCIGSGVEALLGRIDTDTNNLTQIASL